jgi:transposase
MTKAEELLEHAVGEACIADTGYDSDLLREAIKAKGMKPVIPSHPTRRTQRRPDKKLYRIRYRVECHFHWLKRFRRIATRYEKTATSFLAIVHVAGIMAWLQ